MAYLKEKKTGPLQFIVDGWKGLPTIAKVGIAGVTGYGLYKYFTRDPDSASDLTVGSKLSFSENEYIIFADQLQAAFWQWFGEDDSRIRHTLMRMKTNDDVYKLIDVYDTRGEGLLVSEYFNLPESVTKFLDDSDIEKVNDDYEAKAMSVRW